VARNEQFAKRFEREAQTLAALRHENILQIFDHKIEQDRQYMVMEYVEGIDLYDLLDRYGQLPTDVAAIIAAQMTRGLDHAHYRGVIHRDVKPANVMLTHSGTAKLMDFGIARVPDAKDLTQEGTGVGTPSYMSPEQVVGDPLDGRTDVFSLGVVLYQMVTGQKPFLADEDRNVLQKIRSDRPPPARRLRPDLPRDLDRIIGRCLQKRPADRYWPTRELVRSLERHLVGRGVESEPSVLVHYFMSKGVISPEEGEQQLELARKSGYSGAEKRASKTRKTGRWLWAGALIAALALVAGGAVLGAHFFGRKGADKAKKPVAQKHEPEEPGANVPPPQPGEGLLRVLVRPWAEVLIDGKRVAVTPIAHPLRLKEGSYTVTLRNPHCEPKKVEVEISSGKPARVSETLNCRGRKKARGR
jgi:serine/threonine-protein kinase